MIFGHTEDTQGEKPILEVVSGTKQTLREEEAKGEIVKERKRGLKDK
jgi:hypothetical protein